MNIPSKLCRNAQESAGHGFASKGKHGSQDRPHMPNFVKGPDAFLSVDGDTLTCPNVSSP